MFALVILQALFKDQIQSHVAQPILRRMSEHTGHSPTGISMPTQGLSTSAATLLPADESVATTYLSSVEDEATDLVVSTAESMTDIQDKKGYLCWKVPVGPLPLHHIASNATFDESASETESEIITPFQDILQMPLDESARADANCGRTEQDICVIVLLYHKMGTVWWQHALRVMDFAKEASIFTVDSGSGLEVLEASSALASQREDLRGAFPGIILMNNPTMEHVAKVHDWAEAAGRSTRMLIQVRDFRDVLISGYKYHKRHDARGETAEAWLHEPRTWWGEAVNGSEAVSYQQALLTLDSHHGMALEMDMVEDAWRSIALVSLERRWADDAVFVTYEDMWSHPGQLIPRITAFFYGDVRCNTAAERMTRAFLAYTVGFRRVRAALNKHNEEGGATAFAPDQVDFSIAVDLLKGEGTPVEVVPNRDELNKFLGRTYEMASKHFRRGVPGNWKVDPNFGSDTRELFRARFQCLLEMYKYEESTHWAAQEPS